MGRPAGFFDVEERLAGLSRKGDDLERLAAVVDFERFRGELERAVPRADRSKGGRPPFDHVLMFKVLVLQTQNNLSDERTEFYLRDRLTWMRFLGLGLGDAVPDANTIWTFREVLTQAGATQRLFELFDQELRAAGYLAMSGQLVDASIVAAPKQRNTRAEKQELKAGRVPDAWRAKPAKLRQKDRDARPPRSPDRVPFGNRIIRLLTDDGPSSTPRPSRSRTAASRSIWRSRPSVIKTMSAPTVAIA
jgi:transposase, IS5 family